MLLPEGTSNKRNMSDEYSTLDTQSVQASDKEHDMHWRPQRGTLNHHGGMCSQYCCTGPCMLPSHMADDRQEVGWHWVGDVCLPKIYDGNEGCVNLRACAEHGAHITPLQAMAAPRHASIGVAGSEDSGDGSRVRFCPCGISCPCARAPELYCA